MGEVEQRPTPGSRLGVQENAGISTLEHGQKLPATPTGKLTSIKVQMLDDTQESFEVPVRQYLHSVVLCWLATFFTLNKIIHMNVVCFYGMCGLKW